jgi:hypothetical protein
MNELKNKRLEQKDKEMSQLVLLRKFLEKERERFDYADTSQWILDDKCDTDLIFIQEKVSEWCSSAKTDAQKKVLNEMFLGVLRINAYIEQMRTLNKHTVAKYISTEKLLHAAHSEKKILELDKNNEILKLKKDLENAKKEIEFINGKSS